MTAIVQKTPLGAGLGLVDLADIVALFAAVNQSIATINPSNTADTTVGAATLTAAAVVGGLITRSGSTAAYSDTTPTPAQLASAIGGVSPTYPNSWVLTIKNTTAFPETIVAGSGVTVSGQAIVPPLSSGQFLVTLTSASAATVVGLGSASLSNLPAAKYTNIVTGTGTAAAGDLTGASFVSADYSAQAAIAITTRTAAEMFGDTPNAQVGQSYHLKVTNRNSNTLTLTAGSNVTITGTATLATNTTRDFVVTFTSATALTMQSVGVGTIG